MKGEYIEVDIPGLCSITHVCTGCEGSEGRCCSSFEVTLSDEEIDRIIKYMPQAAQLCPHLVSNDSFNNVFDEISEGLHAIDTDEDGTCLFAYHKDGKMLCSLHTVALEEGVPLRRIKPVTCILWPLALFEGRRTILTVDEEAWKFSCTHRRRGDRSALCTSIGGIIEEVFGPAFRMDLEKEIAKGSKWARIGLK